MVTRRENENECDESQATMVNEKMERRSGIKMRTPGRQFASNGYVFNVHFHAPFDASVLALFGGRLDKLVEEFHIDPYLRDRGGLQKASHSVARYKSLSMRRIMRLGLDLRVASRAKIRHDAEQIRYLVSENLISSSYGRRENLGTYAFKFAEN